MSVITSTKTRLARVQDTSWHYRIARTIWTEKALKKNTRKACFYWWVRVPLALIMAPLRQVARLILLILGWFFGCIPWFVTAKNSNIDIFGEICYEYKYRPRKDDYRRFAPWQYLLPPGAIAIVYISWRYHRDGLVEVGWISLLGLGIVVTLAGIGTLIHWKGGTLKALWDKACPAVNFVTTTEK